MLSNGSLTVGLDENGLVHDFYYPYVGLDNLTTSRLMHHKIGVWVDGEFSWVDDGTWQVDVDFETEALISDITLKNERLQVILHLNDFVDHKFNAFFRSIKLTNTADHPRDIRLFMHQLFQISSAGRADTALYVPEDNYLLDYKGRCCLLIYGQFSDGQIFDEFSVGNYDVEGKEGTYKDAEDGKLEGNLVEHSGVDSIIRLLRSCPSNQPVEINYWIIAADSQYAAEKIHVHIKKQGIQARMDECREFWHNWVSIGSNKLHSLDTRHLNMAKKSLLLIKSHIDKRGGIIASCDSSIYNYGKDYYSYVWPRDGSYVIWPLIRMGYTEEPRRFFEFCRDILHEDGYLMHKYQPDKAIGSTWHPLQHGRRKELAIQEDETAIVIYMIGEYLHYSKDEDFVSNLYLTLIQPAANFMNAFIDSSTGLPHASYDLWEEKFLTNTYTAMLVHQALLTAADLAEKFEHPDDIVRWRDTAAQISQNLKVFFNPERQAYRKGFLLQEDGSLQFDDVIDVSSLYGVMMFGPENLHDEVKTMAGTLEKILLDQSPTGGIPRYEHDRYFESSPSFLGNPWFVTTLWMSQYYIRTNQMDKAWKYLDWSMKYAGKSGVLSEQINPTTGAPASVMPLIWSHAEYINTVLDLAQSTEPRI